MKITVESPKPTAYITNKDLKEGEYAVVDKVSPYLIEPEWVGSVVHKLHGRVLFVSAPSQSKVGLTLDNADFKLSLLKIKEIILERA